MSKENDVTSVSNSSEVPCVAQVNSSNSVEQGPYDPFDEEYDDDYCDDYDEEEMWAEQEAEYAATCTCGAWQFNSKGQAVHIADCYCGAE